jgi:hypothetical protein
MPVVSKSLNESLMALDGNTFIKNMRQRLEQSDQLFTDNMEENANILYGNDATREIEQHFKDVKNIDGLLDKCGVIRTGLDKYEVSDDLKNKSFSTNLEKNMNYYMMSSIRKIEYENRLLPVYNASKAMYRMLLDTNIDVRDNMDVLNQMWNLNANNKNADRKIDPKGIWGKLVHTVQGLGTILATGAKPGITLIAGAAHAKDYILNKFSAWISNSGLKPTDANYNQWDTSGHSTKAAEFTFVHFQKAAALAYQLGQIDASERNLLSNPELGKTFKGTMTQRQFFQGSVPQMGHKYADVSGRAAFAIAKLMKDGSWDALTYNEKTGWWDWEETKDRRWYDENGNKKTELGEFAERNLVYRKLVDQKKFKDGDKMLWGWDAKLQDDMRAMADRFIGGSIGKEVRPMFLNTFVGQAFGQFKVFQLDKFTNAFFVPTMKTDVGWGYKPVKITDANGKESWICTREQKDIEDTWRSWSNLFRSIQDIKHQGFTEWWKNQPPSRRQNLAQSMITATFIALGVGIARGVLTEDQRKRIMPLAKRFAVNITVASAASEWVSNPFPMFKLYDDMVNICIGKVSFDHILRYTGPVKSIIQGTEYLEDYNKTDAELKEEKQNENSEQKEEKKQQNREKKQEKLKQKQQEL